MTTPDPASAEGAGRLVLVVEDEAEVMRFLRATLPAVGYRVVEAASGQQALIEAATRAPDLVLLDLGLPDLDGVTVARRLRAWSTTPIIVLSARGREHDKIEALDAGADDYLTKPFGVGELLARMRVALRNAARVGTSGGEPVFEVGGLRVDLGARRVFVDAREVPLTRTQFNLPSRTTCASTWGSYATSWRPTPPSRAISSPRSASAIVCSPSSHALPAAHHRPIGKDALVPSMMGPPSGPPLGETDLPTRDEPRLVAQGRRPSQLHGVGDQGSWVGGSQSKSPSGWKRNCSTQKLCQAAVAPAKITSSPAHIERVTLPSRCTNTTLSSVKGSPSPDSNQAGNRRRSRIV